MTPGAGEKTMNHNHHHWFRLALIGIVMAAAVFGVMASPTRSTQAQTGGTLGYGSKVYGTISAAAPLISYSFSGTAGDFVVVTADTWTGTLDVQIELVAPNGLVLDRSTQNTPTGDSMGAYLSVVLTDPGIYLVRLSGENGTTGDFLLVLAGRSAATATPLTYGQAVDVSIPQNATPQFFSFETESCPTTLVVSNPSQGQPFTFPFVVKVRDQRGATVALLRGGEQVEDWVTVQPDSGRYEVEVMAVDPSLSGSFRLLVTCSGDNPGCPADQAGIAGLPGAGCVPCNDPGSLVPGGGCPILNLTTKQDALDPRHIGVFWDAMSGAEGYSVYVTGLTADGGEVYLTHADWVPGDPTMFEWILPGEGYVAFRFTLHVLVGDSVICSQQTLVEVVPTQTDCPDLGLSGVVTDETVNAVMLGWAGGLGADQFDLDMYAISDAGEEYGGRLVLPGDATGRAFDHFPPHFSGVRFVLWMWREGRLCRDEITVTFEGIPAEQFTCDDFSLSVAASTGSQVDLVWTAYPDADGFAYLLMDASRNPVPGHSVIMAPSQLNLTLVSPPIAPGTYIASVGPWDDVAGTFCTSEVTITFAGPNQVPCAIRADREGVSVRVGPGLSRAVFTYLNPGIEYGVVGQAVDSDGIAWWEIDKSRITGGEAALSLWVAQGDVTALGDCTQVPQAEIPPVIPGEPEEPGPGGGWGACGSCDTCGHPGECVTSPTGECLWDPATCLEGPPPGDGGGCYGLGTAVDPGPWAGSVSVLTATNCDGRYSPGTVVQASASVSDPKLHFDYWSGCGAGGSANPVSFTMTGSCTITAHFGQ
jgi:hypothetical protein